MQGQSSLHTLPVRLAGAVLFLGPLLWIAQPQPAIAQHCILINVEVCAPDRFGTPPPLEPTSISVPWKESGNLELYVLLMRGSTVMASQPTKPPDNVGTITARGLQPGTVYSGLALCAASTTTEPLVCTPQSDLFQVATSAAPPPPVVLDAPSISIIKNNAFGIQFGWRAIHSYSSFNVRLDTSLPSEPINSGGTNGSWMFTSNGAPSPNASGANMPPLQRGTTYALQVQGCGGAGASECSPWGTYKVVWNFGLEPGFWGYERQGVGVGTSKGPSLAVFNGKLYAAWKGVPGDTRMFWSSFDGARWSTEQRGVGVGTSDGPSLAVFNGRLYAAWKGVPGDTRMFWSSFDGTSWSSEQQGVGTGTSGGPSLAEYNGRLYAAWKGVPGDNRMFWSSFDGTNWSPEQPGVGVGTSDGPSLAAFNGYLIAAWKGEADDTKMYYSHFDGAGWSAQTQGVGVGTSEGPRLAVFNNHLFAAWKGVPNDTRMFWSVFDGTLWSVEWQGVGVGTSDGPSIAAFNGQLFAAWKGVPNDTRMFWSTLQ
jgi:hypothetical protein